MPQMTKCWSCRRPGTSTCPWDASAGNTPTPGWTAIPTKILFQGKGYLRSYLVIDCPMFVPESRPLNLPTDNIPTSDEELWEYIQKGYSNSKISVMTGIDVVTVGKRREYLEEKMEGEA